MALLKSEVFRFPPEALTTGLFLIPAETTLLLGMVGTRILNPSDTHVDMAWNEYELESIGSDRRWGDERWWGVDIFTLENPRKTVDPDTFQVTSTTALDIPLTAASFTVTSSSAHEGMAVLLACFNANEVRASFSINGRNCMTAGPPTAVDAMHCSVIDPPFEVTVTEV